MLTVRQKPASVVFRKGCCGHTCIPNDGPTINNCSREAFFRVLSIGGENSVAFHNPTDAMRILGDSVAFAEKTVGLLRQALGKAGVDTPLAVNLELDGYLEGRGKKKLGFQARAEIKDPLGIQVRFRGMSVRGGRRSSLRLFMRPVAPVSRGLQAPAPAVPS